MIYTTVEAARLLRIHPETLRNYLRRGIISGIKLSNKRGGEWRILKSDLEEYISSLSEEEVVTYEGGEDEE